MASMVLPWALVKNVAEASDSDGASDTSPTLAGETDFVERGEYPWVGFVLFRGVGCTGTLVANDWVLTAAHCVPEGLEHTGEVYLGSTDARALPAGRATRVDKVIVHPDYRSESSSIRRIGHDIALLQLRQPSLTRPVTFAPSPLAARHGAAATMLGYGDICTDCGADDRLRIGETTFWGDRKNGSLARAFRDDLDLVTFTRSNDLSEQAALCAGDSGGPVLGEIDGHVGLTAVLSNEIFLAVDGQTQGCGAASLSYGVHVEVAAGTANANWIFATIDERPQCNGLFATIVGTSRDDVLTGTRGRDVIVGGGGNDRISGGGGRDILCGGPGNDVLRGDAGADILRGGGGADSLVGNVGTDRCFGDVGDAMASCERQARR